MAGTAEYRRRAVGTGVLALVVAAMLPPIANAQNGIDLPDQIGTPDRSVGAEEILPGQIDPVAKTQAETITPKVDGTTAEQSVGGRDLGGPDVSDATRKRLGIDCDALIGPDGKPRPAGRVGTRSDPLLTPRDEDARRDFDALELGDDVPPTVILQQ
ncbi:MAG: hypothetical protein AAF371_09905 [Pseudomonadota bacterium]